MTREDNPIPISFVALDLETTGLNQSEHKIIEIGAVKYIDGKSTAEFDRLIDPVIPIPYHITRLTGISKEDVEGAQLIDEALPEFLEFIGDLPLVAHNAPFDVKFIEQSIKSYTDLPSMTNRVYDTFELSRFIVPRMRFHRLSALLDYFNIRLEDAHHAFDDAEGAARLLLALLGRLEQFELPVFEAIERATAGLDWPFKGLLEIAKKRSIKYALNRKIGPGTYDLDQLIADYNITGKGACQPVEKRAGITH